MTTSNPLFRNITTYMATAQSTIFWLLRIYHFLTAHLPIIYLLQIDQLFHHWKSSKYLITLFWKLVLQIQITYMETFRRFIWLQRKAQFFGCCASYNYFPIAYLPIIFYCKSTNYFTTRNRLNIWLICIEKLYDNFKSPISKPFNNLYGYCAKPNFLANAHLPFCYCASPRYLPSANRPIISPLQIV